ncbi:class I SAM-dependent methyltransferase [Solwaraspora sp. WMMA2080]|uniref:class I SAM-dependent methyltransferase n=1 Tax=unclassified Solwaraspora TaxID=2627926 RepID=UPI00248D1C3E|nr:MULTISPECIES: class I SAM-dependent methyltransferase [unclassified Solwaraspora]WBB99838.1 class I SAM-dependent methyltransferase [Solwaraspora sp. WMMA2059]WBC21614.1 class I SAM-dependent methyltransferase [Solwaraspora sp. WMMA2080]
MLDQYQESGEFLDLLSVDAWQTLRTPARQALAGVRSDAPAVDLGAGSGRGVQVLAETVPSCEIIAIEPSPVQRAALHSRIVAAPDLAARTTVVAATAERATLPRTISAALVLNMIGHLQPVDRRALWQRLAARLRAGAPLVVNLQPPDAAVPVPEFEFTTVRVGRFRYQGSGSARPAGPDQVIWRMRYRVLDDQDQPVRDVAAEYAWQVLSQEQLIDELSAAGFATEIGQLGVVRATRS